jgi:hypothetical protein
MLWVYIATLRDCRQESEIYEFSRLSRPTLMPNRLTTQWVSRTSIMIEGISPGAKPSRHETDHSHHLVPRYTMGAAVCVLPHMRLHGVYRDNCTSLVHHWNNSLSCKAPQRALTSLTNSYCHTPSAYPTFQLVLRLKRAVIITTEAWNCQSRLPQII